MEKQSRTTTEVQKWLIAKVCFSSQHLIIFFLVMAQYIIGNWDFLDLTLKLRPPVFIPRPETEQLVGLVIEQLKVSFP